MMVSHKAGSEKKAPLSRVQALVNDQDYLTGDTGIPVIT